MNSASIDIKEIEKFSRLADAWWDENGDFRPLHMINPVRIGYILDKVSSLKSQVSSSRGLGLGTWDSQPLKGLRLLDIGCGGGLLCEPMARLGAQVTGIDASNRNIEVAKLHAAAEGLEIDYRCTSVEALSVARCSLLENEQRATSNEQLPYDIILNMEVIEHVADVEGFLENCCALLKPGGIMILSTLNRTMKSLALAKIGAEYILRWLPKGTHDWRKFLKPGEIEPLLRASGLELKEIKGMSYSPFANSWSLSDDISVNYFMFAVKGKE